MCRHVLTEDRDLQCLGDDLKQMQCSFALHRTRAHSENKFSSNFLCFPFLFCFPEPAVFGRKTHFSDEAVGKATIRTCFMMYFSGCFTQSHI